MSVRRQTWASQKALTTIDCPCNNNSGRLTGSATADKTAKAFKDRLAKLATKKHWLGLANQVGLAELKLVDLHCGGTLRSTPTIDNPPRHT